MYSGQPDLYSDRLLSRKISKVSVKHGPHSRNLKNRHCSSLRNVNTSTHLSPVASMWSETMNACLRSSTGMRSRRLAMGGCCNCLRQGSPLCDQVGFVYVCMYVCVLTHNVVNWFGWSLLPGWWPSQQAERPVVGPPHYAPALSQPHMPPPRPSGDSGQWHIICWHREMLCGDLNSQTKRPGDLDLWPFDLGSGVRVRCDVGYICAYVSLPRLPVIDLLYAKDVGRASSLNARYSGAGA